MQIVCDIVLIPSINNEDNATSCNLKKCNELKFCKKVAHDIDPVNSAASRKFPL